MAVRILVSVALIFVMIGSYYVELDNQLFAERSSHLREITEKVADIFDLTIARSWDSVFLLLDSDFRCYASDGSKGCWRELPEKLVLEETELHPYQDVWDVFRSGSAAPYILEGCEDIWVEAGTFVKNELFTSGSLDGLSGRMDELHRQMLDSDGNAPIHAATVPEDLDHPQTVQLMADLMLGAGGDVAVVPDGGAKDRVPNTGGEDAGVVIKEAYLEFMADRTLIAPEKLCR